MNKVHLLVALMVIAALAAACGSTEPTPVTMDGPIEAVAMPTTPPVPTPTEIVGESGMTLAEVRAKAVAAFDPTQIDLWMLEYKLPDGTTVSPSAAVDSYRLAVVGSQVVTGDLNGDGTTDRALVLVNLADPANPRLYVAAVANENGVWVNQGVYGLPEGTGVQEIRVVEGKIEVDVWQPDAEGIGWVMQTYVLTPVDGGIEAAEPVPAPTAEPEIVAAAPTVGITLAPVGSEVVAGARVDIYVNATNSPGIVKLDWYLDNEKQGEGWTSTDPNGVPYVHHTFVWRAATEGEHYIFVTATDVNGQVGTSEIVEFTVGAPQTQ